MGTAGAGPPAGVREHHRRAQQLERTGQLDEALRAIDAGLALAPKHLELLFSRASVLARLHRLTEAYHAYVAYLAAGPTGQNKRTVEGAIKNLEPVLTTFLEITFTGPRGDVYLQTKTRRVPCAADGPVCREALLPGSYGVIVERAGFERWTGRVVVARDTTTPLAVALVEKPSLLTVRVAQPDARITVDGAPYDAPTSVPAGTHRVVVTLAEHTDANVEVTAREGAPVDVDIELTRAPPPAPPTPVAVARPVAAPIARAPAGRFTLRRKLALAAGGVAVAAAGTSIALGLSANRLEREAFDRCPAPEQPCADATAATSLNRRGGTRALQANIAFGVAGAAAIGAAVLWLTGAPESRVTVAPRVADAGIDVIVRF